MKIKGLFQSSHGFWTYQPSTRGLPKGTPRPRAVYLGTKDRDEAVRQVLDLRGLRRDESRGLKEWADVYCDEMVRTGMHRPITASGVKAALRTLTDWTGNRDPVTITRTDARDFFASLQSPTRTPATTHRFIRYARAFFSWLVSHRLATENPFSKMRLPTPRQSKRDEYCTREQRETILAACTRDDLRGVLMLGFFLGLRINEIVNARWDWFNLTDGICTVRNSEEFTTKTGKERQIPIHDRLAEWLRAQPDKKGYVIHPEKERGKDYFRWNPSRPFRLLMKDLDMTWVTFHTMRHTFGSLHAIAGTAELKIIRWMGITRETWNRHYAGLCPTDSDINKI